MRGSCLSVAITSFKISSTRGMKIVSGENLSVWSRRMMVV